MSTTATLTTTRNGAPTTTAASRPSPRPYRDFLTPCLHRLLTNAALIGLAACYATAILMSPISLFWSWFPLGPAGLRACLLFMSVLCVFILRIANLRIASRQASSTAYELLGCLCSKGPYKTLVWYTLSAFLFSETYIHSTNESKELSITDSSKPYERTHLNERPIVLRTFFVLLGVYQTGYHVLRDLDQVRATRPLPNSFQAQQPQDVLSTVRAEANHILQHATRTMMLTPIPAFLIYTLFLRRTIWIWTFSFSKLIFSNLPKYQKPSTFPPFLGDLLFLYIGWGWVLVTVWGFSHVAFNAYLAQSPLDKKSQPLSSSSKDPNGTLLSGLKSKKEFVTTSAFAELEFISRNHPGRRQTFFKELSRAGGSTWTQLVTVCLAQLQGVSQRINDFTNPPLAMPPFPLPEQVNASPNHLPRMAPPLRTENVFASAPPPKHPHVSAFGSLAKSTGSHPGAQNPLSPQARRLITSAVDCFMSPEQQQQLTQSGAAKLFRHYYIDFVKLPYVGVPFRQTFERHINAIVISDPRHNGSSLALLSNAIQALANLVVCASTEDSWGKASKDVATIIRTYSATITSVENFVNTSEPHWTDIEFKGKRVKDVDVFLRTLKASLRSMLEAYENYSELDLTFREKRVARERCGLDRAEADPFIDVGRSGERVEMRERRRREAAV